MFDIACFNGNFVEYDDLQIHVSDLGLQRGYGIFDFFEIKNGKINWQEDYMDRFFQSLKYAQLPINYDRNDVGALVHQLIQKNNSHESCIKMIVTGGYSMDGFSFSGNCNFILLNMRNKAKNPDDYLLGRNLISEEYLRPNPRVKSLNYFGSAILQKKMTEYKAVDVLYHLNGVVSEASRSNVYIVDKKGNIITPGENILEGITRKNLLKKIAAEFNVEIRNIGFNELLEAHELFITSTTKEVLPIVAVDDQKINNGSPGPVTRKIMSIFNS